MPIEKPEEVPPLIRRFEPVLYLHKDERFFPSDAKRYMEKSALWTVEGSPRTLKFNWGGSGPGGFPRQPRIARGSIAAQSDEPGTFVGMPIDGGVEERGATGRWIGTPIGAARSAAPGRCSD